MEKPDKARYAKLKDLCQQYIWWVIVGKDLSSILGDTEYTSNNKRIELHNEIADLLECEPSAAYLQDTLNYLEKSVSFPEKLPSEEEWEGISKRCGNALAKVLIDAYNADGLSRKGE